jgi:hypothetical protein
MLLPIGLGAAGLALAALPAAAATHPAKPPAAASAESQGRPASYRTETSRGYDARERRMLDCLASDRRYDPALDRIRVKPGVTRRCEL